MHTFITMLSVFSQYEKCLGFQLPIMIVFETHKFWETIIQKRIFTKLTTILLVIQLSILFIVD